MNKYLNYVLGAYCEPNDTSAFCTVPFPNKTDYCTDRNVALRLVAGIDCGTMGALYEVDTLTGEAYVIESLGANPAHSPETIKHDYLINQYHETLPVLADDEVFVCDEGCGDCNAVEFAYCYRTSENTSTGEITSSYHRAYKTSCCGSNLGIWNETTEDFKSL
jgi:hypothetical protein